MVVTYKELSRGLNMVSIPRGAEAISAMVQHGKVQLIFTVLSLSEVMEDRLFRVVAIGEQFHPRGHRANFIAQANDVEKNFPYFIFEEA